MKRIRHNLLLLCGLLLAVGCQREEGDVPITSMVDIAITTDTAETRTYINESAQRVEWSSGDKIIIFENSSSATSRPAIITNGKATFSASFAKTPLTKTFTYNALYPAASYIGTSSGIDVERIAVTLPDTQHATAESFDPAADMLIAKPQTTNTQAQALSMQFKRIVALAKLSITGLPSGTRISEVEFSANGKSLAGACSIDLSMGEIAAYSNAKECVTVNYDTSVASTTPIYFTCNPQSLEEGDALVVRVVTDRATYTRTVEIPEGRTLDFEEGDMAKFSVDMSSAKVEAHELCFKRVDSVRSGGYYLLAAEGLIGTPITSDYGYIQVVEGDADDDGVIMQKGLDNAYLIEATTGGYTIKQASDGRYLYMKGTYDSFNLSSTIISGCDWTITAQDDHRFKIYNKAKSKFVQYSTQHTSYGCYSSMKSYGVMPQLYELTSAVVPPADEVVSPKLSELYALWDGNKAEAGCVVENPEYVAGGKVYFTFEDSRGDVEEYAYDVAGMETYAYITDIDLESDERYSVVAWCYGSDGELVATEPVMLSTSTSGGATPSETWLELPAERTDGRYPKAAEYKVWSGGERNYTHYYDIATYTTLWVAYPLEAKHMGSYSRPSNWSFNPLIDQAYQVNLCNRSYTNSDTYVRGHLIPNASRNGIKEMQLQTFYVTNSVPQIHTNFNSGIWQSLEAALQSIAEEERIYVVTGVAFSKEGETKNISYTTAKDDTKQVPIPNYFYKVVLKVSTNSSGVVTSASTVGFWFENKAYSGSTYSNYAVSVDQIEAWTGFDYFANLPDTIETQAEANSSWTTFKSF